ncbi:MAG: AAA family ATPase [Ilumatobacteraceae bacterium]
MLPSSVEALGESLASVGYLAGDGLATALFCAVRLPQPILLEGEAGVGKTEAAKALSAVLSTPLIRLQCYEGIDAAEALYEWNYPKQLLAIRLAEATGRPLAESELFDADYLVARPLLRAVQHPGPLPAVLLIDEVDRADDEFEAFLLELLAESSVTIPELGTIRAAHPPIVVLTSNRTRDLHDALKRRCLYHWIEFPSVDETVRIIRARVPGAATTLVEQVAAATLRLRSLDVQKRPGIAEAIGWVNALELLGLGALDASATEATIGSVLKYRDDAVRWRAPAASTVASWLISGVDLRAEARPGRHRRAVRRLVAVGGPAGDAGTRRSFRPLRDAGRAGEDLGAVLARPNELQCDPAQVPAFDAVFDQVFRGLVDDAARGDANFSHRSPLPLRRTRPVGRDLPPAVDPTEPGDSTRVRRRAQHGERARRSTRPTWSCSGWPTSRNAWGTSDFAACSPRGAGSALRGSRPGAPPPGAADDGPNGPPRSGTRRAPRLPPTEPAGIRCGGCDGGAGTAPPDRPSSPTSRSMEPYGRAYLWLVHGAVRAAAAEAFVFSTRLTRVTGSAARTLTDLAVALATAAAPAGLVRRDADRRVDRRVPSTTGAGADGARCRGDRGVRRLGRPATPPCSASRWAGCPGSPTGSCGSTRGPATGVPPSWAVWRAPSPTSTIS